MQQIIQDDQPIDLDISQFNDHSHHNYYILRFNTQRIEILKYIKDQGFGWIGLSHNTVHEIYGSVRLALATSLSKADIIVAFDKKDHQNMLKYVSTHMQRIFGGS